MTEEEKLAIRQRLFELLDKFRQHDPQDYKAKRIAARIKKNKSPMPDKPIFYYDNLKEIARILVFSNPYIEQEMVRELHFSQLENAWGMFVPEYTRICVDTIYLFNILDKKISIFNLFDTLGHEQRHNYQHNYSLANDFSDADNYFGEIKEAFNRDYLNSDDIVQIGTFVENQKLFGSSTKYIASPKRTEKVRFGAYANDAHEYDARKFGRLFTSQMFDFLTKDELCTPELKKFLTKHFQKYLDYVNKQLGFEERFSKRYKNLNRELKKIFTKIINGKKVHGEQPDVALAILDKYLSRMIDVMSLDEKVDYFQWAIDNEFNLLLDKINLTKNVPQEQHVEIAEYLQNLLTNNTITREQVLPIADAISELTPNKKSPTLQRCVKDLIKHHRFSLVYPIISSLEGSLICLNLDEILVDLTNYINTMLENIKQENEDAKVCIINELTELVAFLSVNLNLINCDEEIKNNFLAASGKLSSLEYSATLYYTDEDFQKDYIKIYGKKEFEKYKGYLVSNFENDQLNIS